MECLGHTVDLLFEPCLSNHPRNAVESWMPIRCTCWRPGFLVHVFTMRFCFVEHQNSWFSKWLMWTPKSVICHEFVTQRVWVNLSLVSVQVCLLLEAVVTSTGILNPHGLSTQSFTTHQSSRLLDFQTKPEETMLQTGSNHPPKPARITAPATYKPRKKLPCQCTAYPTIIYYNKLVICFL